eukprot:SAG31_NODE_978_length_10615_cov_4.488208_9_plen_84_part_00
MENDPAVVPLITGSSEPMAVFLEVLYPYPSRPIDFRLNEDMNVMEATLDITTGLLWDGPKAHNFSAPCAVCTVPVDTQCLPRV